MALSEFDIIGRYFASQLAARSDVAVGIGDDGAVLSVPPGRQLAVSMDTLVEGRHFFAGTDARALGHKALAVNLSDLAAMAAEPAWATLALTLPAGDEVWLDGFMQGFAALAARFDVQLVGGDLTRGPLSITVQAHGFVDPGALLLRSGGQVGDEIWVSGSIGDAGLALQQLMRGDTGADADQVETALRERLDRPLPRVALGLGLRGLATAAIDISDGLVADLGHICTQSTVGAELDLDLIPLSRAVAAERNRDNWAPILAGGDDYELLFSAPAGSHKPLEGLAERLGLALTPIGRLVADPGIRLRYPDGRVSTEVPSGFDHFREPGASSAGEPL